MKKYEERGSGRILWIILIKKFWKIFLKNNKIIGWIIIDNHFIICNHITSHEKWNEDRSLRKYIDIIIIFIKDKIFFTCVCVCMYMCLL